MSYIIDANQHCIDRDNSISFLVNGESISNINLYELRHNDRILISFGDSELISEQLEELKELEIHDVPKVNKLVPGRVFPSEFAKYRLYG